MPETLILSPWRQLHPLPAQFWTNHGSEKSADRPRLRWPLLGHVMIVWPYVELLALHLGLALSLALSIECDGSDMASLLA